MFLNIYLTETYIHVLLTYRYLLSEKPKINFATAKLYKQISFCQYITFSHSKCFRVDILKSGTLVGEDKFGNKYYENNSYFYGKPKN